MLDCRQSDFREWAPSVHADLMDDSFDTYDDVS